MSWRVRIQKPLRKWKLGLLLHGPGPRPAGVSAAVDEIIERARRDEKAGLRRDQWLFGFESEFEEISDEIAHLKDIGETDAYKELYGKLYAFAADTMADSYMPLYLYILYRYASALLETGEAEQALQLFEKLYAGTDRLIGIRNPYGIHCLEVMVKAAVQCGQAEKTERALQEMYEIAKEDFGPYSAMTLAVLRYTAESKDALGAAADSEAAAAPASALKDAKKARGELYRKCRILLGDEHPVTARFRKEYAG